MAESTLPPGITSRRTTPRAAKGQGKPRASRTPRTPDSTPIEETPAKPLTDDEIQHALAELLSGPAFIAKSPLVRCDECAKHFRDTAPETAKGLMKFAEQHPAMKGFLRKVAISWYSIDLAPTLIGYFAFPMIHHGPESLQVAAPLFGVPHREPKAVHYHAPTAATAGTSGPTVSEPPESAAA